MTVGVGEPGGKESVGVAEVDEASQGNVVVVNVLAVHGKEGGSLCKDVTDTRPIRVKDTTRHPGLQGLQQVLVDGDDGINVGKESLDVARTEAQLGATLSDRSAQWCNKHLDE